MHLESFEDALPAPANEGALNGEKKALHRKEGLKIVRMQF
jgi:hypothetical protein